MTDTDRDAVERTARGVEHYSGQVPRQRAADLLRVLLAAKEAAEARDADRKQVREQALREALAICAEWEESFEKDDIPDAMYAAGRCFKDVRALIEKDKTNDG